MALAIGALGVLPAPASAARTATSSVQPAGIPGTWNLVFDDEFTGTSLDTGKWSTGWGASGITKGVNSAEDDCYDPAQVSVSGSALNLTAIAKSESCGGSTKDYATGGVTSDGQEQFTYGAFQARIYLPTSSNGAVANWPAWWTDGQNWPTDGEMDVMEGLDGQACYHFHSQSGGPGGCAGYNFGGWHTYGADWEPGSVTYYYDGKQVGQITTGITSAPQYLIFDYAVGGYGGITVAPATMKVDYARVWSH